MTPNQKILKNLKEGQKAYVRIDQLPRLIYPGINSNFDVTKYRVSAFAVRAMHEDLMRFLYRTSNNLVARQKWRCDVGDGEYIILRDNIGSSELTWLQLKNNWDFWNEIVEGKKSKRNARFGKRTSFITALKRRLLAADAPALIVFSSDSKSVMAQRVLGAISPQVQYKIWKHLRNRGNFFEIPK